MIFLAIRHILSRKKQTLLILLGIVLGTTAYVMISAIMLGFQQYILDRLINNTAHISITAREQYITPSVIESEIFHHDTSIHWLKPPSGIRKFNRIIHPHGWYQKLNNNPNVLAYAPQLRILAMASHNTATQNILIIGCNPTQQSEVTHIAKDMIAGHFSDLKTGGHNILLGVGLAQKLGIRMGDMIQIATPKDTPSPFKVIGIFKSGIRATDDKEAYTALVDLQNNQHLSGVITDIAVRVKNPHQATDIAQHWQHSTRDRVSSWQEDFHNILSVFKMQTFIRYFMSVSILLVSAFGIYNVLHVVITQKKRQIAILRVMGYTSADITCLFLMQGLLLGLLGGLIGLGCGYVASLLLASLPAIGDTSTAGGRMVISFNATIYLEGFLLAFVSSALSSWIPSHIAGRLTPLEIIRSEVVT